MRRFRNRIQHLNQVSGEQQPILDFRQCCLSQKSLTHIETEFKVARELSDERI